MSDVIKAEFELGDDFGDAELTLFAKYFGWYDGLTNEAGELITKQDMIALGIRGYIQKTWLEVYTNAKITEDKIQREQEAAQKMASVTATISVESVQVDSKTL